MLNKSGVMLCCLTVLIWGFLSLNSMAIVVADDVEETIIGNVVAAGWDEDGNVSAVAISVVTISENSEGEEEELVDEYMVGQNDKGEELLGLVGMTVEATGIIKSDHDGHKTIFVKTYRVIEDSSDEPETEPDVYPDEPYEEEPPMF